VSVRGRCAAAAAAVLVSVTRVGMRLATRKRTGALHGAEEMPMLGWGVFHPTAQRPTRTSTEPCSPQRGPTDSDTYLTRYTHEPHLSAPPFHLRRCPTQELTPWAARGAPVAAQRSDGTWGGAACRLPAERASFGMEDLDQDQDVRSLQVRRIRLPPPPEGTLPEYYSADSHSTACPRHAAARASTMCISNPFRPTGAHADGNERAGGGTGHRTVPVLLGRDVRRDVALPTRGVPTSVRVQGACCRDACAGAGERSSFPQSWAG